MSTTVISISIVLDRFLKDWRSRHQAFEGCLLVRVVLYRMVFLLFSHGAAEQNGAPTVLRRRWGTSGEAWTLRSLPEAHVHFYCRSTIIVVILCQRWRIFMETLRHLRQVIRVRPLFHLTTRSTLTANATGTMWIWMRWTSHCIKPTWNQTLRIYRRRVVLPTLLFLPLWLSLLTCPLAVFQLPLLDTYPRNICCCALSSYLRWSWSTIALYFRSVSETPNLKLLTFPCARAQYWNYLSSSLTRYLQWPNSAFKGSNFFALKKETENIAFEIDACNPKACRLHELLNCCNSAHFSIRFSIKTFMLKIRSCCCWKSSRRKAQKFSLRPCSFQEELCR